MQPVPESACVRSGPTVWFGRFCDVPEFSGMRHESVKLWAGIQRRRSEGDNLASRIKIALAGSVDMSSAWWLDVDRPEAPAEEEAKVLIAAA